MLLLKTQTRILGIACSFPEEQAVSPVSESQMEWLHFLGNQKSHLTLIFLTVLVKRVGNNNCVQCLLEIKFIHYHTQQQEKSGQRALHQRWLQEGYQYSTPF